MNLVCRGILGLGTIFVGIRVYEVANYELVTHNKQISYTSKSQIDKPK